MRKKGPLSDVVIGMITPGSVNLACMTSLIHARDAGADLAIHPSGPYLDVGRNVVMKSFREESKRKWLVWIDSDVALWTPEMIELLIADPDKRPVVSGVYHNFFHSEPRVDRHGVQQPDILGRAPVLYRWIKETQLFHNYTCREIGCCPEPARKHIRRLKRDADGYVKVDGFGAGYLALHREVIDAVHDQFATRIEGIEKPVTQQAWFCEQTLGNGIWYGEDYMLAMRVADVGAPIYAHPGASSVHYKNNIAF